MYIVYSIFQTIYQIPNYGLGAELTLDYRERNSLFSWEQAFSVARHAVRVRGSRACSRRSSAHGGATSGSRRSSAGCWSR